MTEPANEQQVVAGLYDNYQETQKEILEMEIRKTKNKLFTIAIVIFLLDFLALMMADQLNSVMVLWVMLVPAIITGLGFLAIKEPMLAMIIGAVIVGGLWIYAIISTGGLAAVSGWISKAVIIYLFIAGFQNAREAQRLKKELGI
ncbi:MAG TPA: hypothetical protein VFX58_17250 [Chitinophagaceae bacterium]|nr:hypothetical protein [Chitinophagaceae bacterium]